MVRLINNQWQSSKKLFQLLLCMRQSGASSLQQSLQLCSTHEAVTSVGTSAPFCRLVCRSQRHNHEFRPWCHSHPACPAGLKHDGKTICLAPLLCSSISGNMPVETASQKLGLKGVTSASQETAENQLVEGLCRTRYCKELAARWHQRRNKTLSLGLCC